MDDKQKAAAVVGALKCNWKIGDSVWLNRLPAPRYRVKCAEPFIEDFNPGWPCKIEAMNWKRNHSIMVVHLGSKVWCKPSDIEPHGG